MIHRIHYFRTEFDNSGTALQRQPLERTQSGTTEGWVLYRGRFGKKSGDANRQYCLL